MRSGTSLKPVTLLAIKLVASILAIAPEIFPLFFLPGAGGQLPSSLSLPDQTALEQKLQRSKESPAVQISQISWEAEQEESMRASYRQQRAPRHFVKRGESNLQIERGNGISALIERMPLRLCLREGRSLPIAGRIKGSLAPQARQGAGRDLHYHSIRNGYIPDREPSIEKAPPVFISPPAALLFQKLFPLKIKNFLAEAVSAPVVQIAPNEIAPSEACPDTISRPFQEDAL